MKRTILIAVLIPIVALCQIPATNIWTNLYTGDWMTTNARWGCYFTNCAARINVSINLERNDRLTVICDEKPEITQGNGCYIVKFNGGNK